ncbi:Crp/Fnr family transcriptional regulator [Lacticaseibacillus brantae]|uniref:Crp-like transcriptional regulator n=1 Tax=Lacticaseibacillus brantae DSM 23927 TaxID=1423727 RepID=A0A0R2BAV8_9LACO|nr:Crp/Fnr family transcriptional regulator [Lacticaseibacillus brantae]KRM72908.1 Crp-like transcriptional regulator [Lacticaseibacillus brantae DSM 23927]
MTEQHHCVTLVPLFNHLPEADQDKVNQLVSHQQVQQGSQILAPDTDPRLVIVARGSMKVYQLSASGHEQLLRVVEPGGYEGENVLFGASNDSLFSEALQPTEICVLRQADFQQLLRQYPEISLKLLAINANKMLGVEQQAQFLSMARVEERLASYLLDLRKASNADNVVIPMKMRELATHLGTTPETLSRKLKQFQISGLIRRERQSVTILDADALEEI